MISNIMTPLKHYTIALVVLFLSCIALGACESGLRCVAPANACSGNNSSPLSLSFSTSVLGRSSMTAQEVNNVLRKAGSPAQGSGEAMVSAANAAGIKVSFALAVFHNESSYGTQGWGRTNKALGNIRCTQGYSCSGGYRSYRSWELGYKDFFQLINVVYVDQRKLTTVDTIIPIYAPAGDNNKPYLYIQAVQNDMAIWN